MKSLTDMRLFEGRVGTCRKEITALINFLNVLNINSCSGVDISVKDTTGTILLSLQNLFS